MKTRKEYVSTCQVSLMTDILTPDVPGSVGLLPLDHERVSRVVGFLNDEATTNLAIRVLSTDPASAGR
jgi:hypothetical protein